MLTDQGTKSFKVYRKFNGKPVRVTLGKYPEMTIENARNAAQRVISDMISGKNPNEEKKTIRSEITFGEMFEIFMERHSKVIKKSWIADQKDIPRFLGSWFKKKLSNIKKNVQFKKKQLICLIKIKPSFKNR